MFLSCVQLAYICFLPKQHRITPPFSTNQMGPEPQERPWFLAARIAIVLRLIAPCTLGSKAASTAAAANCSKLVGWSNPSSRHLVTSCTPSLIRLPISSMVATDVDRNLDLWYTIPRCAQ
eukprot:Platyproteum_vivax@DN7144_c0_g1_i1.p1